MNKEKLLGLSLLRWPQAAPATAGAAVAHTKVIGVLPELRVGRR